MSLCTAALRACCDPWIAHLTNPQSTATRTGRQHGPQRPRTAVWTDCGPMSVQTWRRHTSDPQQTTTTTATTAAAAAARVRYGCIMGHGRAQTRSCWRSVCGTQCHSKRCWTRGAPSARVPAGVHLYMVAGLDDDPLGCDGERAGARARTEDAIGQQRRQELETGKHVAASGSCVRMETAPVAPRHSAPSAELARHSASV